MANFSQVSTALRVSPDNFSALTTGTSLVSISRAFIREGQQFVLVGADFSSDSHESSITYWAACESSQVIEGHYDPAYLRKITHLPEDEVQGLLDDNANFLVFLRVYRIPVAIQQSLQFNRQYAALPSPIAVVDEFPIVSRERFIQRRKLIETCTPSEHPELEELQAAIALCSQNTPISQTFNDDLQRFLGWAEPKKSIANTPDWINKITTDGNTGKGDLFEKGVRLALLKLGFSNSLNNNKASLNPCATGGAGGIDIYCDKPFSLAGECKATKHEKVSSGVAAQLICLGNTHLDSEIFNASVKVLFVAGNLTNPAKKTALGNKMNIMRPEILQRLVKLSHQYPGSIDLRILEKCLRSESYGEASEEKIQKFFDQALSQVALRSQLIQLVKDCHEKFKVDEVELSSIHGAYAWSQASHPLSSEQIKEILIELSSPLTGYLGRVEDEKGKKTDRFYYLRDLPAPKG
jgi:hypothetical protein